MKNSIYLGTDPQIRSVPDKSTVLPGGNSKWEPPDPIPNSEVKLLSADDSLRPPHAKVGHRQALKYETPDTKVSGVFFFEAARN
jgi:hypothetical protein